MNSAIIFSLGSSPRRRWSRAIESNSWLEQYAAAAAVVVSRRRAVAVVTAIALVVKLFAVAILLSVGAVGGDSRIPICTADGVRWITLKADNSPLPNNAVPGDDDPNKPGSDRPCPYCLAGIGGVPFLIPIAPRLSAPGLRAFRRSKPWGRVASGLCHAARPPPSRAPPFLSH